MPYDFTGKAAALLKRVAAAGGSLGSGLAKTAVELALRDAYEQGKADASGATAPQVGPGARGQVTARSGTSTGTGQGSGSKIPARSTATAPAASAPGDECAHVWNEAFLDGRKVGSKCTRCGVLEQDVQARCSHYFVTVGKQEVCVACRQLRGGNPRS
jgi:hypothetical protein